MTVENQLFEDVPHQLNMVMFYCHVSFRGNSPLEKSSVARGIQNVARKKKKKKKNMLISGICLDVTIQ